MNGMSGNLAHRNKKSELKSRSHVVKAEKSQNVIWPITYCQSPGKETICQPQKTPKVRIKSYKKWYFLKIIQYISNDRKYESVELNDKAQDNYMSAVWDWFQPEVKPKVKPISAEQQAMCIRLTFEVSNYCG